MKTFWLCLLSFTLFFISTFYSIAQDLDDVKEVEQFWVGLMDNVSNGSGSEMPSISIVAVEDAEGFIEFEGNRIDFDLTKGEEFYYTEDLTSMIVSSDRSIENKGIYIYSEGEINVTTVNRNGGSVDATDILPISQLGSKYMVSSHWEVQNKGIALLERQRENESLVLLVSVADNTLVRFSPNGVQINGSFGPFEINLNRGETYQFQARGDLSGSEVEVLSSDDVCNRVAVFTGNRWADIGDPECGVLGTSHIYQQSNPDKVLDTEYFHIPMRDRVTGALVKVIGSEDQTNVFLNGQFLQVLNRGEFLTEDIPNGQAAYISADKPIKVFSLGKSFDCVILSPTAVEGPSNGDILGNPHLIEYLGPSQFTTDIVAFNPQRLAYITYAQLVTRTVDVDQMLLNGTPIGNLFNSFPGNPNFSYAQVPLLVGVNQLTNANGFGGYIYRLGIGGLSLAQAFANNFSNSEYQIESDITFERNGDLVVCANQEGTWTINGSDPSFSQFEWDFGDDSEKKIGQTVTHTYEDFGEYEIKVFAFAEGESCDIIELHIQDVIVEDVEGELTGTERACPNDELIYTYTSESSLADITWEVIGGEIIDELNIGTVVVRWGTSNPNASISAVPLAENGCEGPAESLSVDINLQLEPEAPVGQVLFCEADLMTSLYQVPEVNSNRGYEWIVQGGTIVSAFGEREVEIEWDSSVDIHTLQFREFSLTEEFCEGLSPVLEITINSGPEVTVASKEDIQCFGEENGRIELSVEGGTPPYQFVWSHDPDLNSTIAENLASGNYSVIIEDDLGCISEIDNILIEDVPALQINSQSVSGVTCFGQNDGTFSATISGGVPPYDIDLAGAAINGGSISFSQLEAGIYEQEIRDANGCFLPISFEITSPDPLEVQLNVVQAACPGESNGIIEANLIGGTPPYSYEWLNAPSSTSILDNIPTGDYSIRITDATGCVGMGQIFLPEESPESRMPTGFNPDDGLFEPISACHQEYVLTIFNRWGNIIYSGNTGWDGTFDGKNVPVGSYAYSIDYNTVVNNVEETVIEKGSFVKVK
ncbi:PKD domain-containing protein [Algoriphagus sediminis]|uniref:Gliding motility-associated C-terminal domain-containing protein n=1 Tax=Algoriphagus sediminis TaxID=3057113 RepID=A0ABT7YHD6_9BACT|nr:PKD domain-containing protein [Algoriphagus sediminis]MDN3205888.1 gliding motility-associated C-terminal domain-containing protein [Algoriphagus sediminis]